MDSNASTALLILGLKGLGGGRQLEGSLTAGMGSAIATSTAKVAALRHNAAVA